MKRRANERVSWKMKIFSKMLFQVLAAIWYVEIKQIKKILDHSFEKNEYQKWLKYTLMMLIMEVICQDEFVDEQLMIATVDSCM